ncbi:HlyD family type I secretion periplasmic adaptor subunit [Falsiroseomonas sp. CW058]|uniref:HlyD family type I secretion periplasmic adaptor subunit n=1 Tax=Falsiroseomonas sp. CW058 TaxID=3388664 RepID=UPI003D31EFB8
MSGTVMTADDAVPEAELEAAMPAPSLRRVALASVFSLVVGLGGLLGWAAATPIERAVVANGTVVAEGRRKTIQLLEPGLLRELLVREGEVVAAGQPLLRLDVTQADALANQARVQRWSAAARLARLRAEQRDERVLAMPDGVLAAAAADPVTAAMVQDEERLFAARWQALEGQLAVQDAKLAQMQEQLAAAQAQRAAFATRLRATREELAGVNQLLARGFATRTRQLELQRAEAEFLGSLGQFAAQEAQTRQAMAQAELEKGTLMLNRRSEVSRDLQDAQSQLADATERLRSAEDLLARREVPAPEDGVVTDIRFVTPGSSIGAGQPVMDLVPRDDRLVVETQVALTDIEQVRVGSPVNIRLTAYRQRETPLVHGRISYVSADRQQDQRGTSFFVVRAEFDPASLAAARGVQLAAGMPAEAFILGERRSALDYLVRPVEDSLRRSLRD